MYKISNIGLTAILLALVFIPVTRAIAQRKDFNSLHLALRLNQTTAQVIGSTGGGYSLASIVNQDRHGNHCMGFGDPEPDHTLILENDFSRLKLQVNSGGKDTTLVVKRVDDRDIRCGFGKQHNRDAVIIGRNWQAGRYNIWVGSMKPSENYNYSLSVEP